MENRDDKTEIQSDSDTIRDSYLIQHTDGSKFSCNRRKRPLKDKKEPLKDKKEPIANCGSLSMAKKACSVFHYIGDVSADLDTPSSFDIYPGVCFPTFRLYTNAILWVILQLGLN